MIFSKSRKALFRQRQKKQMAQNNKWEELPFGVSQKKQKTIKLSMK